MCFFFSDQHMNRVDNLKEFKKVMMGIEPEYPDVKSAGLDFFSVKQAKAICNYINTRYVCHSSQGNPLKGGGCSRLFAHFCPSFAQNYENFPTKGGFQTP